MELNLESLNNEIKNHSKRIHKCEVKLGIIEPTKRSHSETQAKKRSSSVKNKDKKKKDKKDKKTKKRDLIDPSEEEDTLYKPGDNKKNEDEMSAQDEFMLAQKAKLTDDETIHNLELRVNELEFNLNLFTNWFGANILHNQIYQYGKPVGNKSFLTMETPFISGVALAAISGKLAAIDQYTNDLVELNIKYNSLLSNYKNLFDGLVQLNNPNRIK
ncbi:MAG: hypothetical protein LBR15_09040 [Methanobrevibacter sp.]|jgi:hypothetical protein|nr:hypothetical protein [Candidatus Methanovirga australis]